MNETPQPRDRSAMLKLVVLTQDELAAIRKNPSDVGNGNAIIRATARILRYDDEIALMMVRDILGPSDWSQLNLALFPDFLGTERRRMPNKVEATQHIKAIIAYVAKRADEVKDAAKQYIAAILAALSDFEIVATIRALDEHRDWLGRAALTRLADLEAEMQAEIGAIREQLEYEADVQREAERLRGQATAIDAANQREAELARKEAEEQRRQAEIKAELDRMKKEQEQQAENALLEVARRTVESRRKLEQHGPNALWKD